MNTRQMLFPIREGGQATLSVPEALTLETIQVLEEASALAFSALRRDVLQKKSQEAGVLEYDSWAANFH